MTHDLKRIQTLARQTHFALVFADLLHKIPVPFSSVSFRDAMNVQYRVDQIYISALP